MNLLDESIKCFLHNDYFFIIWFKMLAVKVEYLHATTRERILRHQWMAPAIVICFVKKDRIVVEMFMKFVTDVSEDYSYRLNKYFMTVEYTRMFISVLLHDHYRAFISHDRNFHHYSDSVSHYRTNDYHYSINRINDQGGTNI